MIILPKSSRMENNKLPDAHEQKRQGKTALDTILNRRDFLMLLGKTFSVCLVTGMEGIMLTNSEKQTQISQPNTHFNINNPHYNDYTLSNKNVINDEEKGVYFLLRYKTSELGYSEKNFLVPLHKVRKRVIKEKDSLEKWWVMEEQSPSQKKLYQLIFLLINEGKYYPKNFSRNTDLNSLDIKLILNKNANFLDINDDGKIMGEYADKVSIDEVLRITSQKNNYGELLHERNR